MRYNESTYVADIFRLLHDYFRACGCSDAWLFGLSERAVSSLWQWHLARRAMELFRTNHQPADYWEEQALSFCEYLLSREDIVWMNELRGYAAEETEELEELPL
jgi:hypothetical protein